MAPNKLFTSKFWCRNAFVFLTLLDPWIMVGVWRYSWGDVEFFFSYPCDHVQTSILQRARANHFFVLMRCLLCERYGPWVCNKSSLLFFKITTFPHFKHRSNITEYWFYNCVRYRCQAKFLTSAKFLTYYCLSDILLLTVKE